MNLKVMQFKNKNLDFENNKKTVLEHIKKAESENIDILLFPLNSISGGHLKKLSNYKDIQDKVVNIIKEIEMQVTNILVVLSEMNSTFAISNKKIISKENNFVFKDKKIIVNKISGVDFEIDNSDCDYMLIPACFPYFENGYEKLLKTLLSCKAKNVMYANSTFVGDNFLCEGKSSIIVDKKISNLSAFKDDELSIFQDHNFLQKEYDFLEEKAQSLILILKNYLQKCGFKGAHLGLSGGIDSALIITILSKILPSQNIKAFLLPSPHSSKGSVDDAIKLCQNLDIDYSIVDISKLYNDFLSVFKEQFSSVSAITDQCIQSRIRGNILMAYSNNANSLLIETGNKSEDMTGYCTLYGDTTGGIAPIGDLYKTEVYQLANYFNKDKEIIPQEIIQKAPSAELAPGQKDQDNLPNYDLLDKILFDYIENNTSKSELENKYKKEDIEKTLSLIKKSQFKREQIPPTIMIKKSSFKDSFPIIY